MYTIKQGGRVDYNYKEMVINTAAEITNVPVHNICPGSTIYIIENGDIYMLNEQKEWIKQ